MHTNLEVTIRPFVKADYLAAFALWSSVDGLGLNESDTEEAIAAFLDRNPGFCAVAVNSTGEIVGTVMCGHNGRNGYLQHLAVADKYRGQGIAKNLIDRALQKLAEARIPRCNVFVYSDNLEGNAFWRKHGWSKPEAWHLLQKPLPTDI